MIVSSNNEIDNPDYIDYSIFRLLLLEIFELYSFYTYYTLKHSVVVLSQKAVPLSNNLVKLQSL